MSIVTPLKAVPSSKCASASVRLEELTQMELTVAFYVADYHRSYEEMMDGPNVVAMADAAAAAVARIGIDLIRQIAVLADYAAVTWDRSVEKKLWPEHMRHSNAEMNARLMRTAFVSKPRPFELAAVVGQWESARDLTVSGVA